MTSDLITYDDVIARLREVVRLFPKRINPLGVTTDEDTPDSCLYTHPDDHDWHCLAGELLTRFGCRLPWEGQLVGASPDRDRFTFDALTLLSVIQSAADRDYMIGGRCVYRATPWAAAYLAVCELERLDPWTGERPLR